MIYYCYKDYAKSTYRVHKTLSLLVETSFYAPAATPTADDNAKITEVLLSNPVLAQQIMQLLQANAVNV